TKPPPPITPMPKAVATPAPAVPTPPPTDINDDMLTTLLGIVSEKTGYPVDLLEPGMSLEADLGIDSIKRVEILGVMQDTVPGLPPLKPDEMARLDTLGQIADYIREQQTANFSQGEGGVVLPSSPAEFGEVQLRNVVLTRLPHPDRLLWSLPSDVSVLITDDGSPLVDELVSTMQTRQWDVIRLALPGKRHHKAQYQLDDHTEAAVEKALAEITTNHGAVGVFIHVVPQADYHAITLNGDAKAQAKLAFFLTKHVHEPLHIAAQHERAACLLVTRTDGKLGTTGRVNDVVSNGLSGFIKTVALEWQDVFCRLVDVDRNANDTQAVQYLMAELDDPDTRHREIGYADAVRYTLDLEPYA
ncbi:MAG: phosphopantetheine-binding protein, partial [Chloroflexota bacterium]